MKPEPPSCAVVLTSPDGRRMLSDASLKSAEEAWQEAESWRHTASPSGGMWGVVVRTVAL